MVTSTTCGAQEWVQSDVNGWVVDAINQPELARRLDDLAALAGNAAARSAARTSVEALTLPAMAERLLALYRSLGQATDAQV
jgi:UDP-glucose:(heptosyl)LPS alpha-1,3-glucosyltransferase